MTLWLKISPCVRSGIKSFVLSFKFRVSSWLETRQIGLENPPVHEEQEGFILQMGQRARFTVVGQTFLFVLYGRTRMSDLPAVWSDKSRRSRPKVRRTPLETPFQRNPSGRGSDAFGRWLRHPRRAGGFLIISLDKAARNR